MKPPGHRGDVWIGWHGQFAGVPKSQHDDALQQLARLHSASRTDEDGVLILSEFAGAADELHDACIVNPYDVDGVAETIHTALSMDGEIVTVMTASNADCRCQHR